MYYLRPPRRMYPKYHSVSNLVYALVPITMLLALQSELASAGPPVTSNLIAAPVVTTSRRKVELCDPPIQG